MKYISEIAINSMSKIEYEQNLPFPHIIIDNFFKEEYLEHIVNSVNSVKLKNASHKFSKKNKYEYNKITWDLSKCDKLTNSVFDELNSNEFLNILEKMSGVENIVNINHTHGESIGSKGSGIHKTYKDGYLGIHTDFNTFMDSKLGKLDRRINILIYLNPDWNDMYLGHLKLFEYKNLSNQQKILPILNRWS